MPDAARVFSCLPKATLLELPQKLGFKGWPVLNKGEIVERLAGDESIPLESLLTSLKIPSLKNICQDLGLDTHGSKKDLVGRILGEGESPPTVTSPKPPIKESPVSSNDGVFRKSTNRICSKPRAI